MVEMAISYGVLQHKSQWDSNRNASIDMKQEEMEHNTSIKRSRALIVARLTLALPRDFGHLHELVLWTQSIMRSGPLERRKAQI